MALPRRPIEIVHHMAADEGASVPNSLEAIVACLRADASWIEIDVTALADSDYLLVHDPVLQSETTGLGPVGECSVERAAGRSILHSSLGGGGGDDARSGGGVCVGGR